MVDLVEETNTLLYDRLDSEPSAFKGLDEIFYFDPALSRTCQHCAHWEADSAYAKSKGAGECGEAEDWAENFPTDPGDCFGATDAEGYHARVWTGPRFGCVHWRSNESD